MAKTQFSSKKLSVDEAQKELANLRSGKGGRTSMYQPVLDEAREMDKGEVLKFTGTGKARVSGMRGFLDRYEPDTFVVRSAREDEKGDKYTVFVMRKEDVEE